MDAERFTGTRRGEAGPFSELPQLSPQSPLPQRRIVRGRHSGRPGRWAELRRHGTGYAARWRRGRQRWHHHIGSR